MINLKKYEINNITLTNDILSIYINKFWDDIFNPINNLSKEKHLFLMCKVLFNDNSLGYRTLGHLRRVNYDEKELFINYIQSRLGLVTDAYSPFPISIIQFSYIIKDGLASDNDRRLLQDLSDKYINSHKYNNIKLPISMIPEDYGTVLVYNKIEKFTRYIVTDNKKTYQIDISLDGLSNNVRIIGQTDLQWIDRKLEEGFMREIGKSLIYFVDGEKVLRKQYLSAKPFTKLNEHKSLKSDFITMDIETINNNGLLSPYLICGYNGSDYITSYSYENNINKTPHENNNSLYEKELFKSFIDQILLKNKNVLIYAHNLSGFDGIFLLKHLLHYGEVKPLIFNGKLISIELKSKDGVKIVFKDSYLMLPLSLRKLCKAFNIISSKGYFPFLLNNIFYKGELPPFDYWTDISYNNYLSLKNEYDGKTWDFKNEAIKYCQLDCKSLHQVLTKFNELIFNYFKINMTKALTLPSLAMIIYRTHYMSKNSIYQLLGNVEQEIRESYTGGAVDVYKAYNKIDNFIDNKFKKLFYYDVNSLYPTVMSQANMPVGKPIFFEGDILKYEPNAFGYFYCKITSPEFLEHPILQRKIKTNDGIRTIAALGTWKGYIFSEEMKNAIKFGYKFKVIKGYQFEQGNLFSKYIDKLYNLRLNYPKLHPMNLIAKLLMNSLYGKFGMKSEMSRIDIYDCSTDKGKKEFHEMLDFNGESIIDYIKIEDKFLIIRNSLGNIKYDEDNDYYHGIDVNVAIASAITAYARIYMTNFKNNTNFTLYYTDTDSIVIDKELSKNIIGNKLGQLKLEHIINRAVFLAPKVYALISNKGEKIIKIKGINSEIANKLTLDDFENLLFKDQSLELSQDKWFKKIIEGEITIKEVAYKLKISTNKRKIIYDDNLFINTLPYNYNDFN